MRTLRPKCLKCKKACRKNQRQFQCVICKESIHRKCSNLTVTDIYKHEECNVPFYCHNCNHTIYPLNNEDEIDSLLNISSSRVDFECGTALDAAHLNNLFVTEVDDSDKNTPNISSGFKPIPEKYYNAESISFDDFEITSENQFADKFSSIGINIRSLANTKNFAKLQAFIDSLCFSPTVIAINETYLRDNEAGPHCDLKGYVFISNCRKSHKGGGVGLYVKDFIDFKVIDDLTIMDDKIFESLFIEVNCADTPVIYGTIYRSPNGDCDANYIFLDYLKKCVSKIRKTKKGCIIQGDLNYNLINVDDSHMNSFSEVMFDNSFYPHVNLPTRITGTSATCIDHIWSNIFSKDVVSGIISETIADHMITFQCSDFSLSKNDQTRESNTFSKIDYGKLEVALCNIETNDTTKLELKVDLIEK